MPNPEMRKPVPRNRRPAIRKATTAILSEILGMVAAGLIFTATLMTSAFGMAGGFDHMEPIVLAEVDDGR